MWPRRGTLAAAAVCLALAVVHTWPLATAPHVLSLHANADAMLNEWILTWIQHQLPRDPAHIFDGNIFHPASGSLAFSEPLFVPALMGAPVRVLGGSPVLVHNLLLIAGLTLTALATYGLVLEWTGDRAAALVGASAFAFNTHTLTRLAHLQAMHAYGLPLTLLATDRLIVRGRTADAAWLTLWMTVMAYTSGYLLLFGAVLVAVGVLARAAEWRQRAGPVLARLAAAALATAVLIAPVYVPYRRVALEHGLTRPLEAIAQFSATPLGYLTSASRLHLAAWSHRVFRDPVDAFFPGILVFLLSVCAIALVWRLPRAAGERSVTRARVAMLAAIAAVGCVLSLGTNTPLYGWLYGIFPPLRGIRAAARFGGLFLLAAAALAGIGFWRLRSTARFLQLRPWLQAAAAIAAVAAVNVEALAAPFAYVRFGGVPIVYSLLAREPGPVVLVEQPFYPPEAAFENAEYVLNSTAHWRPLMNGYSGYTPATYRRHAAQFWFFPRPFALEAMRAAGVTHVMVHPRRFGAEAADIMREVNANPRLERLAVGNAGIALYRMR